MPTKEELNDLRKLREMAVLFRDKWGDGAILAFHVGSLLILGGQGLQFKETLLEPKPKETV